MEKNKRFITVLPQSWYELYLSFETDLLVDGKKINVILLDDGSCGGEFFKLSMERFKEEYPQMVEFIYVSDLVFSPDGQRDYRPGFIPDYSLRDRIKDQDLVDLSQGMPGEVFYLWSPSVERAKKYQIA